INLLDSNGDPVLENGNPITTTTDNNGDYIFTDVEPGEYQVQEINSPDFPNDISDQDNSDDGDPTDSDTTVDNIVGVTVEPGEADTDNDFVDGNNASISGTVTNENGDPIPGVTINLLDSNGDPVLENGNPITTTTDNNGDYIFTDVEPGEYQVQEINSPDFPNDISDQDNSDDGDPTDSDTTVDNIVGVTVEPGEADTDNDFVDGNNASISGTVFEDTDNNGTGDIPLEGVTITLRDDQGNNVATTTTGSDGTYSFNDVEPGDYEVVQTNLPGYQDVSDQDNSNDGDPTDNNTTVDNIVGVTLEPGEDDTDNDFVDEIPNGSISGTVTEDTDNNGTGDTPLADVEVVLRDDQG
ncbi:MAG: hypothetical protein F6K23_08130, partial [Okeania sp. SIO2C9]|uniref:SdrD B-like domain-containing protein n=1 Tax=Okeania sp. SIO2C9 TaxID=2607791 RepID=UPI0013C2813D